MARVLTEQLDFSKQFANLTRRRALSRSTLVQLRSTAQVPQDPKDGPILQAALSCGADYLVTNDRHLLALDPFEGLRIVSMHDFFEVLKSHGYIS